MLTIGLPVYNDVKFIEQSILSILKQSYTDFKLIISDDCSTDGSADICLKYAKIDNRIKYIKQKENIGISRNMEYLLSLANSKYFMWAGDDDLMAESYVEKMISALENNSDAIIAFSTFIHIDENDHRISENLNFDYSEKHTRKRIKNFIKNSHDEFGYAVFKTDEIKGVRFPVWHWPNRKCAYNNIYPSLLFYLSKGNYTHVYDEQPLFFKRVKTPANTNHKITFQSNGILESFAFYIRRLNLVHFSVKMIRIAKNASFAISLYPMLWWYWLAIPSINQTKLLFKGALSKIKKRNKHSNK